MADHDLGLYLLGLLFLALLALMLAFGIWLDRQETKRLDRAYEQSVANRRRLAAQLGESEAAAILMQHVERNT